MELNSKNMKKLLLIITFTVLLYLGLTNLSKVVNVTKSIIGIMSPFILGLCIAFIVGVLLKFIEEKWDRVFKKTKSNIIYKLKRPICICISFALIIGAIFILIFMIVPEVGRTVSEIAQIIPFYMQRLENWWNQMSKELENIYVTIPAIEIDWKQAGATIVDFLTRGSKSIFSTTVGITTSIFGGVFSFIVGFIFSIYILFQKENLCRQIKKIFYAYLKEDTVKSILNIAKMANVTFSKFVTGQLTEAIIIGLLCFIGMNIFSMPYATMISTLVGFTALIPLVGAFIGTAFGGIMILMVDPMKALWFVVFIIILQQLEGNIIYPRVVGKSVGLPGMWVLVAITVGGSLLGIFGMLLSVPTCSVLYALLRQSVNKRLSEKSISHLFEDTVENEIVENSDNDEEQNDVV